MIFPTDEILSNVSVFRTLTPDAGGSATTASSSP